MTDNGIKDNKMTDNGITAIYVEVGTTRSCACSWAWPGWCRYGKTVDLAVQSLRDTVPRYGKIAQRAGLTFDPQPRFLVTQFAGNTNTDWAPTLITARDTEPWDNPSAQRGVALLRAAWASLEEIAAMSSPLLRKGPRGGGRDLDEVVQHVIEAERAYARKIGVKQAPFSLTDQATRMLFHDQITTRLGLPSDGSPVTPNGWPPAYAVRRLAWHVIDHLWEIEDRQC